MPASPAPAADIKAAIIVCLDFGDDQHEEGVEESVRLVESAGVTRHRVIGGKRQRPDSKFYAGVGKVAEIAKAAAEINAGSVVFNHELSPAQARNLEKELQRRILDRTDLILEIFAQRAQTSEGKLQVELAQLQRLSTRLVRGWTHLERQAGGFGKTGGPGEKQLELDRRYIGKRVAVLKDKLEGLKKQRDVQRKARAKRDVLSISLVGYTNAGKSTLFNALAHAKSYEADKLFATLDTTSRRVWIPGIRNIVLSDTVGFIRDLPDALVAAFRATLEEIEDSDLLIHLVDAANPNALAHIESVDKILLELKFNEIPQIIVLNKTDLLDENSLMAIERHIELDKHSECVAISAIQPRTLRSLVEKIGEILTVPSSKFQVSSFLA